MQGRLTCRAHTYITHFSYARSGAQCRRRAGVRAIIGSFFSAARSRRGLQSCQEQKQPKASAYLQTKESENDHLS